jgi:hypothetical protein
MKFDCFFAHSLTLSSRSCDDSVGVGLENGDCELQLNPNCLRYLGELYATYGDSRNRPAAAASSTSTSTHNFGPMRIREIQALLKFLSTLKLLKVTNGRTTTTKHTN